MPHNNKSIAAASFTFLHGMIFVFLCSLFFSACDEVPAPKPKGYFRIELPEKKYTRYQAPGCTFSFDIPDYAVVAGYHDSIAQPCWKYIRFPRFNGEIFLSYKAVDGDVGKFMEDARALAYKHTVKADAIDETAFEMPGHLYGLLYDIGGNAASSVQFYVTDSTSNFIRGALYFNVAPQPDSLAPVIGFLREDIVRMITSMQYH